LPLPGEARVVVHDGAQPSGCATEAPEAPDSRSRNRSFGSSSVSPLTVTLIGSDVVDGPNVSVPEVAT
jgi:hypothetical protein